MLKHQQLFDNRDWHYLRENIFFYLVKWLQQYERCRGDVVIDLLDDGNEIWPSLTMRVRRARADWLWFSLSKGKIQDKSSIFTWFPSTILVEESNLVSSGMDNTNARHSSTALVMDRTHRVLAIEKVMNLSMLLLMMILLSFASIPNIRWFRS